MALIVKNLSGASLPLRIKLQSFLRCYLKYLPPALILILLLCVQNTLQSLPNSLNGNQLPCSQNSVSLTCAGCQHANGLYALNAEGLTEARVLRRTVLIYPEELHSITGTVILEVTVLPDSSIGYIEVKESIPELDSLAILTVENWEFLPSYRNGEPVIGFINVELQFDLEKVKDEEQLEKEAAKQEAYFLRKEIARYLSDKRESRKHTLLKLPLPIVSENYHLFSPFRQRKIIRRNRFTILPGYMTDYHILQTAFPFYEYKFTPHRWDFFTEEYDLPITLVDAHLGLGNIDMDYGHLTIMKNELFDVPNLHIKASYITEDGYWLGDDGITQEVLDETGREQRSDLMVDLYYTYKDYSVRLNTMMINQKSPSAKFRYLTAPDTLHIDKRINEYSIHFETPYLDIGYRYEKMRYDRYKIEDNDEVTERSDDAPAYYKPERILQQLLLGKGFSLHDHSVYLQVEGLQLKETDFSSLPYSSRLDQGVFSLKYDFDTDLMYLDLDLLSGLGYEYFAASEAGYKFSPAFQLGLGYVENDVIANEKRLRTLKRESFFPAKQYFDQNIERDIYTIAKLLPASRENQFIPEINFRIGQQKLTQETKRYNEPSGIEAEELETEYVRSDYNIIWDIKPLEVNLYGFGQYYLETENFKYLPDLFIRNTLELRYRLAHNNIISAGIIYYNAGKYSGIQREHDETARIDTFVRLSITDKFDIQADMMNITDEEYFFGIPDRAGRHFNFGIRWFFFN